MIKKILVPTDYSPASLNALDIAIEIARTNNAALQILQITETNINPLFTRRSAFRKNSQLICDAMAGSIFQKHGVSSEIIFAEGVPGAVIARAVYEKKPDLVIMGAHGGLASSDSFIGSNAYYVIGNVYIPVMIIPAEGKWTGLKTVLYPVSAELESLDQLDTIRQIISGNGKDRSIEIFTILSNNQPEDATLISKIVTELDRRSGEDEQLRFLLSYNNGESIGDEVFDKLYETRADLLVLSSRIDAGNNDHSIGPLSRESVGRIRIPFLNFPKIPVPTVFKGDH